MTFSPPTPLTVFVILPVRREVMALSLSLFHTVWAPGDYGAFSVITSQCSRVLSFLALLTSCSLPLLTNERLGPRVDI
ncbi:hypothetical protein V8E53_009476 [Lactarius tabidus]